MPLNPVPGTPEDDDLTGTGHRDLITGEAGDDDIHGLEGNDLIYAGDGRDTVDGGPDTNRIYGGNGADLLAGGFDIDTIFGDNGADMIFGGRGEDWVYGGAGNDIIYDGDYSSGEINHSFGGAGDDLVQIASHGGGTAQGGAGTDTLLLRWSGLSGPGGPMTVILNGPDRGAHSTTQTLDFSGFERLVVWTDNGDDYVSGGALGDDIYVGQGNDTVYGYAGDDLLKYATGKAAQIFGGDGVDTVVIWNADFGGATLTVTGTTSVDNHGGTVTDAEKWQFWGNSAGDQATLGAMADAFHGSGGDDTGWGMGGRDHMHGGFGQDTLYGGDGGDRLQGGSGDDLLFGGAGADHFSFSGWGDFGDHIGDMESGTDHIEINGYLLDDLLPVGAITADQFALGQAQGAGPQFVLKVTETSTGELIFDANGSAEGGETLIVRLVGAPLITFADILIF